MRARGVSAALLTAGLVAGCSAHTTLPPPRPSRAATSSTPLPLTAPRRISSATVLVWSFGGYPPSTTTRLLHTLGAAATPVATGSLALATGVRGYPEIPAETIAVDPDAFAAAMGQRQLATSLAHGAVLSQTASRLRRARAGATLQLADGRHIAVTAVVPDIDIGGYEIALSRAHGVGLGVSRTGYLLVRDVRNLTRLARQVHLLLGPTAVRIRRAGVRPFLRAADDVLPQALVKARFGEFALRRSGTGFMLDPDWVSGHIVTTKVPILGSVTCNRAVMKDLSAALTDLEQHGLSDLIDVADFHRYGGCFNPRPLRGGGGEISRHAWGIAIDVNVAANPLSGPEHQDPRLITTFERHHFTWGGHWLRPDPQHFEWVGDVVAYTDR
jgi:hypothetical protein